MAYRTRIRPILLVGVVFTVSEAFLACGSLNDVHVNVTDAPGGGGGSAGSSVSSAGHAGTAASGAGGTHANGGTSNSADAGQAGEGEAGAAAAAGSGGVGGSGEAGGRGGSGGASGAGGGGVAGQGGAAGHGGASGTGGGGTGGTSGACNTVVQVGGLVTPTAGVGAIPALVRSMIPVGTYALTSEVWYGGRVPTPADAYRSTLAVSTNGAATIVIQALNTTSTANTRFTMHINTTAAPPNGVQITCSTDPTTPLNADVQVDYSGAATTLKLAFGTTALDVFTKQ